MGCGNGCRHYDRSDTDDDCSPTDTALQALVRSNALYRGHPAVVRAAPGPTPMRNADSTRDATVSLLGDTRGSTGGLDDLQGSSPSSTRANDESKTTPTGSTLGMPQHKSSPPRGLHQRPWQAMGSDADSATQPSLQVCVHAPLAALSRLCTDVCWVCISNRVCACGNTYAYTCTYTMSCQVLHWGGT